MVSAMRGSSSFVGEDIYKRTRVEGGEEGYNYELAEFIYSYKYV